MGSLYIGYHDFLERVSIGSLTSTLQILSTDDRDDTDVKDPLEMDAFYNSDFRVFPIEFDTQDDGYHSSPASGAKPWLYCPRHEGDLFLPCPMCAKLFHILVSGESILCVIRQKVKGCITCMA